MIALIVMELLILLNLAMSSDEDAVVVGIMSLGVVAALGILEAPAYVPLSLKVIWLICDAALIVLLCYWYISTKRAERFLFVIKPTLAQWAKMVVNYASGRIVIVQAGIPSNGRYHVVQELSHFAEAKEYLERRYKDIYGKWTEANSDVKNYNDLIDRGEQDTALSARYKLGAVERLDAFRRDLTTLLERIDLGKES